MMMLTTSILMVIMIIIITVIHTSSSIHAIMSIHRVMVMPAWTKPAPPLAPFHPRAVLIPPPPPPGDLAECAGDPLAAVDSTPESTESGVPVPISNTSANGTPRIH